MPYAQDEYCEHVRLHVTNYAVVAYPVAPQATVVSAYLFDRRVVGLNNVGSVMRRRGVDERKRDCYTLSRIFVMLMRVSQMGTINRILRKCRACQHFDRESVHER